MSETPRLRSAFPATPRNDVRSKPLGHGSSGLRSSPSGPSLKPTSPVTKPVQNTPVARGVKDGPLVSLDVVDAPTQRFYVAAFYIGLFAWRIYNSLNVTDELDSTWLFLKWLGIDAAFFVALPAFRVPWMEWSFFSTLTIWLLHAVANFFLMYKIPIPVLGWLGAMAKVAYDRELAISEHRVKPADILHNSSIILGKQIIQILPEGSAILNPNRSAFCLDSSIQTVELPLQINQTSPISIELVRYDLDTNEEETIMITQKQAKKLKYEADKGHAKSDTNTPRLLRYPVSKTGLYHLARVVDETKLEVRKKSYDVAVVSCPRASVSVDAPDKCTGDLSGISIHMEGVPPFKVKYSKRINRKPSSSIEQTVQPSESDQDMADNQSNIVLDSKRPQMGQIQSKRVSFEINESLKDNGTWSYHVEEVEDGLGNKAVFGAEKSKKSTADEHAKSMVVHRRPIVSVKGCNSPGGLPVREGDSIPLPVEVKPHRQLHSSDWPLTLRYSLDSAVDGDVPSVEELKYDIATEDDKPRISTPGRYSLESVQSQYCQGEVNEPSSCTLYNPPKPDLTMQYEEITDNCAGNTIGLTVNLDFIGTPPFRVTYSKTHEGSVLFETKEFNKMRGQILIREGDPGLHIYQIREIQDRVYGTVSMADRNLVLRQTIIPLADADFQETDRLIKACLGETKSLPVFLSGEGPWDLDYELVHGGKRQKFTLHSEHRVTRIDLPELTKGGKYSIVLTSIRDSSKCRNAINVERQIEVRGERPSVSFGDINGQRLIKIIEGNPVDIPLRLKGQKPWVVHFQNMDRDSHPRKYVANDPNDKIRESEAGTYQLLSVEDRCLGTVDTKANKFTIEFIQRPGLKIKDANVELVRANEFRKAAVCQGHEDSLNLAFTGNPPYHLKYNQLSKPLKGPQQSVGVKPLTVASSNAVIKMDTSKAGEYTYSFEELADDKYAHNKRYFSSPVVRQQVYPLPAAKFTHAGKVYGYCKEDSIMDLDGETETIPVTLEGSPPFSLEVAVTHHGSPQRPEIKRITDIPSNTYSWSVPRSSFDLGTHILSIRSVKDGRGCESIPDGHPSTIRIQVSSPPTIIPLESTTDYCVGDHVSFSLAGQAPFDVYYTFQGRERRAPVTSHEFRRITDAPGEFIITGVSDSAMGGGGRCRARKDIRKTIHAYPSVRIERGQTKTDDIHEGGEVDIHFSFTGAPPFEFTYTRSENINPRAKSRNKKPAILETRQDTSNEFSKIVRATEEGTYEVIAIKDRFCAYSAAGGAGSNRNAKGAGGLGWKDQKLLKP